MQINDIDKFATEAKQGTNVAVNLANELNPENKKNLAQEIENFVRDMKAGTMSYAEMRARYG